MKKNWQTRWFNIGKCRIGFIIISPPGFSFTLELHFFEDSYNRVVAEFALCILSFAVMLKWMPSRYNVHREVTVW